ncbi:uncharacterized protein EAE97_002240 [Botrytis byssoidea]|uniref:Uncharacterized protein n=1 Tax=Botrytis byssoidea TaxID=139641 RepID=A0A9P5M557_9HELO|nr:uncharacterized protein EAE97_002240 [Botrytis byssoidea]KAF7950688.1 hypothetical protein EAE97_002240 [Botrytis byssoidea]
MVKRLFIDTDDLWSELGADFRELRTKQCKSHAGSSPNSPLPVSPPTPKPPPDPLESIAFSSIITFTDDTPLADPFDLSRSPSPLSTLSFTSTDISMFEESAETESTMAPKEFVLNFCTIRFSKTYYLDFQIPRTYRDPYFDLSQDPTFWPEFFHFNSNYSQTKNVIPYIRHCLRLMYNKTGDVSNVLAALVFAWTYDDELATAGFWAKLYEQIMAMLPFRNAAGQEIVYLGRFEMPGGVSIACWNKAMQEFFEEKGYLGEFVYFAVTSNHGFEWLQIKRAEEILEGEQIPSEWVVELPRNEYYC